MTPNPFNPASIGGVDFKNRLVLAPMTTYSSHLDGVISEDELPYLAARAEGGFGTVMTAACCVHRSGHAFRGQWSCEDDKFIPSLRSVAEAVQKFGAKAVLQIHHGGRQCPPDLCGEVVSASAIPAERENAVTPRAMTDVEIEDVISSFGQATRRAREAGYDGVEIHGANTYLIQQFVSPHSNRLEDKWGQDRLLFARRVVESVLANAGDMFVGYRFSPEELETPGIRWEQTSDLVEFLCQTDLHNIHVSTYDFRAKGLKGDWDKPALVKVVEKSAGRKPVMGVGGVWTAQDAQELLDMGADFVVVGKAALLQADWPKRILTDEPLKRKIPKGDYAKELIWPAGLAAKAKEVKGWFEFED